LLELGSDDPHSATAPFSARPRKALLGFLELLNGLLAQSQQADLHSLLDALLERLHFREALEREYGSDEADERWNNVQELYSIAADYVNLPPETQLPTLLEEIALVSDTDRMDQQADTVTCITLHQAKGLEFRVVFLIGLEEGLLPHSRSLGDKDKLDEERRLLYVGATRAQERLYLLYAFRRTVYGSSNISTPSRFLADIPQNMLERGQKRPRINVAQSRMFSQRGSLGSSGRSAASSSSGRSSARTDRKAAAQGSASFFPGQRVQHNTFGEGIVVSSRLVDGDEEVVVNFGKKGEKKLLASFARLRRLG
jgi:DNA helicase-2/ATP-dependent DNA helicase PcrA